jgi:hypothetical protein
MHVPAALRHLKRDARIGCIDSGLNPPCLCLVRVLGFGFWGVGCGVWDLGFRVSGLCSGFRGLGMAV